MLLTLMVFSLFLSDGQDQPAQTGPPKETPVRVGLKLGAQVSPRFSFAGGLDIELNRLSIAPGWSSRIDLDALLEPARGGLFSELNTASGVTFNQIYGRRQHNGRRVYGGLGIGYYNVPVYTGAGFLGDTYDFRGRVGGKVFIGTELTSTTSAEMVVHLIGGSQPLLAVQARLKL